MSTKQKENMHFFPKEFYFIVIFMSIFFHEQNQLRMHFYLTCLSRATKALIFKFFGYPKNVLTVTDSQATIKIQHCMINKM